MALSRRERERQDVGVALQQLPPSPGHMFYWAPTQPLAEAGFDARSKGCASQITPAASAGSYIARGFARRIFDYRQEHSRAWLR